MNDFYVLVPKIQNLQQKNVSAFKSEILKFIIAKKLAYLLHFVQVGQNCNNYVSITVLH